MSRVTDAIEKGVHLELYRYMIDNCCTVQKAAMNPKNKVRHFYNNELMLMVDAAIHHYKTLVPVEYILEKPTKKESFTDLLSGDGLTVGDVMGRSIKWRTPNNEQYQ